MALASGPLLYSHRTVFSRLTFFKSVKFEIESFSMRCFDLESLKFRSMTTVDFSAPARDGAGIRPALHRHLTAIWAFSPVLFLFNVVFLYELCWNQSIALFDDVKFEIESFSMRCFDLRESLKFRSMTTAGSELLADGADITHNQRMPQQWTQQINLNHRNWFEWSASMKAERKGNGAELTG